MRCFMEPSLIRRLVYMNDLYTYPIAPLDVDISLKFGLRCHIDYDRLASDERQRHRLIDFARRELVAVAPWLPYVNDEDPEGTCVAPLNKGAPSCLAIDLLAKHIVEEIACRQAALDCPDHFVYAMRQFDRRRGMPPLLLQSVSDEDLAHLAWELQQFARFQGDLEAYYRQMCLFEKHTVMNNNSKLR